MDDGANSQPSGMGCFVPFAANSILTLSIMQKMHPSSISVISGGCPFSIGNASLGVATCESTEYHMGVCNTILVEP